MARLPATVHTKLLAAFLLIALLLLSMGMLSVAVLARIDNQVETLTALDEQTNRARQMIYEVTVQSHYRAMALVTEDPSYIDKIYAAKDEFAANLAIAGPVDPATAGLLRRPRRRRRDVPNLE